MNDLTQNQLKAFGFSGENLLWSELIKFLNETQQTLMLQAVASSTRGEDRIHFCGQADAVNYVISALIDMRKNARSINGLTPEEDLA
jgi:hypothetical protein